MTNPTFASIEDVPEDLLEQARNVSAVATTLFSFLQETTSSPQEAVLAIQVASAYIFISQPSPDPARTFEERMRSALDKFLEEMPEEQLRAAFNNQFIMKGQKQG